MLGAQERGKEGEREGERKGDRVEWGRQAIRYQKRKTGNRQNDVKRRKEKVRDEESTHFSSTQGG